MIANIVSVSGGKDSTATLLVARAWEVSNLSAVFADTGHEHPETYEYVHYLEDKIGIPIRWVRADFADRIAAKRKFVAEKWPEKGVPQSIVDSALSVLHPTGNPFLDLCLWKGRFPSTRVRFCTEELKSISPRIPPARRTDAEHPQCASATPGGGQADGLAFRFATDLRACSSVPCAST